MNQNQMMKNQVEPVIYYNNTCSIGYKRPYADYTRKRDKANDLYLNQVTRMKWSLLDYFESLQNTGYAIFHMTTTYIVPDINQKYANRIYTDFYLKNLVPYLMNSRRITTRYKLEQPICYSFIDEPDRQSTGLHHHSIIASSDRTYQGILSLCGNGTLSQFHRQIKTSDLKRCDYKRIIYAAKDSMLRKYPDYLAFGFNNPRITSPINTSKKQEKPFS